MATNICRAPLISILASLTFSVCVWSQEAVSFNKTDTPDPSIASGKTTKDSGSLDGTG